MNENAVKIQVRIGQSEVSYEGPISFLQSDLFLFMKEAATWCKTNTPSDDPTLKDTPSVSNKTEKFDLSMVTIASRLGGKKPQELIVAACAYLTLVEGKKNFNKKEIHEEMKKATGYYQESHGKNLGRDLRALIRKGDIKGIKEDSYALSAEKKKKLEAELSG